MPVTALDDEIRRWVKANPEPMIPSLDATKAEYDAAIEAHRAWGKLKGEATMASAARLGTGKRATTARVSESLVQAAREARQLPEALRGESAMPFPVAVLPSELQTWALATAEFTQTPKSMACMFALMAAMTASIHLDVRIAKGWVEPCVFQSILLAAPSERKSPVFKAAFVPVYEWGRREKQRFAKQKEILQKRLDNLLVDDNGTPLEHKRGSPEAKEMSDLKQEISAVKPPRRRICDDITPEEFIRQMADNDGTMCLVSDEADVFQTFAGRYAGEAKLGPLLKGWDSKSPLMYDRVGGGGGKQRVNIVVDNPRAGISIAGQHSVLGVLIENPVYRDKGMLARLMYVVLGERSEVRRLYPECVPRSINDAYNASVARMFEADASAPLELLNCVEHGSWLMPSWLCALRERIEIGLLGDGEFSSMPDWAGKLVSNMARVAAVLESMGGGGEAELTQLSEFFITHGKRALSQPGTSKPATGTVSDQLSSLVDALSKKFPSSPADAASTTRVSKAFTLRDAKRSTYRYRQMAQDSFESLADQLLQSGHLEEQANEDAGRLGNKTLARKFVLVTRAAAEASVDSAADMPTGMPKAPVVEDEFFGYFDNEVSGGHEA